MMKNFKTIISVILVFCSFLAVAGNTPQDKKVPNEINVGLATGNAKVLSSYFNQNVELVVLDNDNVYSKAQAQQIVTNFFSKFPPVAENAFSIIHDSGKENAQYVIGKLKTEKGNFRVYFLLKQNSGKQYIHQLRIEQQ
ncbi:DUF4783 domain-containing protein [Draconibacterium halophilum]|uniref:DUF4783 domain-containing protein n=1 Tax=Draconibacterium halophilum TaxID=2706887 RepID=A0A6C0RAE9_9BACT|nr:DUF4783 domain-containing protein [Draconibacterium halophilum]QIA06942.1 DUF4783 domain-containing protein [Draconibacterium halophilum]